MNRTKKTISWCDYSWNPVTGCSYGCPWCYARKISMRFVGHFKPTLHIDRLGEPMKVRKPSFIFADSMGDFWGDDVKQWWRDRVYNAMKFAPQHTYFLLTKQPQNIKDAAKIPKNCWVGVSVTCFKDRWRIGELIVNTQGKTFVSIEPILEDDAASAYIYLTDWVIVGCLTGSKKGFKPKEETIDGIAENCRRMHIPLFIKNNCNYKKIQQYPEVKK